MIKYNNNYFQLKLITIRTMRLVIAFAHLKIIFLLTIIIYIIYITRSTFIILQGNFSSPGPPCSHGHQSSSWELLTDHVSEKDLKYRTVNRNLRTLDVAESIEELDFLLNIRRLIVFAVHELNRPLKFTKCAKWWANPLDLVSHEERSIAKTHTDHLIKFLVQPGNLRVQVTIRQQSPPIKFEDRELEILGSFEIEKSFIANPCDATSVLNDDAKSTCLCSSGKKFEEYNQITTHLRKIWNITDMELRSWPPDKSFSVGDYMNFTDYEWFVRSPGNTTQEVNTLHYSKEYCTPNIKMLVMVSSAPDHFKHRKVIRETYASPENLKGKGIKVVFLMGVPSDSKINKGLQLEADVYKDIIQANFVDSYHNLTISHLSMYKWAHLTCINGKDKSVRVPPFILKADDDFFLNVHLALKIAHQNKGYEFIGCLYCGTKAIRNIAYISKYYTPRYMHMSNSYAGYLSGVAYLLRTDVIPRLLHMSITTPLVHMDDVYVSGILLRQLNIHPMASPLFTYGRTEPDACKTKKMACSCVLNPDDMITQWKMFVEPLPSNCTLSDLKIKVGELDNWRKSCFFKE